MDILVNDRPFQSARSSEQTFRQLAQEACLTDGNIERMVVSVRCNGEDMLEDRLIEMLDEQIDQFERIELQTQPIKPLVQATLQRAIVVFGEMNDSRTGIADHLAAGDQSEAMRLCQEFFNAWKQIQDCLIASAQALHIPLEDQTVEGRPFADIVEQIRIQLTELRDALQASDFVLVGDILRYELEEPFSDWMSLLKSLHQISQTD